eukprot:11910197-Ditylum_brightwellii.AAC.1
MQSIHARKPQRQNANGGHHFFLRYFTVSHHEMTGADTEDYTEEEEEEENDPFSFLFDFNNHENEDDENYNTNNIEDEHDEEYAKATTNLTNALHYISQPLPLSPSIPSSPLNHRRKLLKVLEQKTNLITTYMGTMAQCRGNNGDTLRNAGAIDALLYVLYILLMNGEYHPYSMDGTEKSIVEVNDWENVSFLPPIVQPSSCNTKHTPRNCHQKEENHDDDDDVVREIQIASIELAAVCLGSLRDLSCGSALNRSALLRYQFHQPPSLMPQNDEGANTPFEECMTINNGEKNG